MDLGDRYFVYLRTPKFDEFKVKYHSLCTRETLHIVK